MSNFRAVLILLICAVSLFLPPTARAVIKVDLPVSKRFAVAKTAIIGKVSAVDAEHRVVEVATVQRLKDDASPAVFRLQFAVAPELVKSVKVGDPVVFMAAMKASVHIADTWLVAAPKAESNRPLWVVSQVDNNAAAKTFPGTTAALARVLVEMKAGKSTLLDEFQGKVFAGGVQKIAALDVAKPTCIVTTDLAGDGTQSIIVAAPAGVRAFALGSNAATDIAEKWELKGVHATVAAIGDVKGNGKPDLLLDGTLYLNDGQKLTPAPNVIKLDPDVHIIASALMDFTGVGKRDAGFSLSDGRLLVFKNDGQTSRAWKCTIDRKLAVGTDAIQSAAFGDFADNEPGVLVVQEKALTFFPANADHASADFERLAGDSLLKLKGFAGGLKNAAITPINITNDHRPSLLITTDNASMVLINRGFGTYLPDTDAGGELEAAVTKAARLSLGGLRTRSSPSHGSDGELLMLSDDGQLFMASGTAAAK